MKVKGLIAGLGNPGPEYQDTRHNYGFMVADHLIGVARDRKNMKLETLHQGEDHHLWKFTMGGGVFLLLKPMAYMNRSGKAVGKVAGRFELAPAEVLVMHDELDLPMGRMKLKKGGGTNGHRGLDSIVEHLNTRDFHRLKLGIGRPDKRWEMTDWVLGRFSEAEAALADEVIPAAFKGLGLYCRKGPQMAAQALNPFRTRAELARIEEEKALKRARREQEEDNPAPDADFGAQGMDS